MGGVEHTMSVCPSELSVSPHGWPMGSLGWWKMQGPVVG